MGRKRNKELTWDAVNILSVLHRLNAKIIAFHRDPLAQYLSIQRGRVAELQGSNSAWHCFDESCKQENATHSSLRIVTADAAAFLAEAKNLDDMKACFQAHLHLTFEGCTKDREECVGKIYSLLGLPPRTMPVDPLRVSSKVQDVPNAKQIRAEAEALVRARAATGR